MPSTEAGESELCDRFFEIVRATSPLMCVLSASRGLGLPDWLVFQAQFTSLYSIT